MNNKRLTLVIYASADGAGAAVFFGVAFFFGAAVFLVGLGGAVPLETRPDLVLVRTAGFSVTAGAYRIGIRIEVWMMKSSKRYLQQWPS